MKSGQAPAVRVNIVKAENAHELFEKRLDDWKRKGFDCTGLDELLEAKDYVAFKEKSIRMLKKEFERKKKDSPEKDAPAPEKPPEQEDEKKEEPPGDEEIESQLDEDVVYECPKCGNLVGATDERCAECGVKFL